MEDILHRIRAKRLIFTVTTGRSGTKYLTYLLSLLKDFTVEHEANPAFHGYLKQVQKDQSVATDFWINEKLPHILNQRTAFYADTSHVACKGFLEALLALDIIPDLIILKRNNADVAKSLYQLETIPGRSVLGMQYLISPDDNVLLPVDNWQALTDYQLCYWYTLEIEKRQEKYASLFSAKGSKIGYLNFEDLVGNKGFDHLRKVLKLPDFTALGYMKYLKNKHRIINHKLTQKKLEVDTIDIRKQEEALLEKLT